LGPWSNCGPSEAAYMKVELKSAHIVHALALAEEGVKGERRIRDTLVPGLCLRIRGRSAS